MYQVRLKIKQTEYFDSVADKRFALINKCHNIAVKHSIHLLNQLRKDTVYQAMLKEHISLKKEYDTSKDRALLSKIKDSSIALSQYRNDIGLSKSGLESYIKVWQKAHSNNISSHQAQKEVKRVMAGVEKVLFSNGKQLHFRKFSDATTLCGKSPTNGVSFDREKMMFKWMGERFQLKPIDKNDLYMIDALYPNGTAPLPISYCEIKRMMFPNGWHYYLDIYIKGTPPNKHLIKSGTAGIDPGTSTMAVSTSEKVLLRELAPDNDQYTKKIQKTIRAMDKSKRNSNPDNFYPDGRAIKGKKDWHYSKRYKELLRKYRSLCRQKSLYIRQSHNMLANEILQYADKIIVEHMSYKGLQRRTKTTERQDKPSTIINTKGKKQTVYKFKRKRRFGKSLGSRAPAEFLTILKQKLDNIGGQYVEIDTIKFKASQYDHSTDTYKRSPMSERSKLINGVEVQRDLYSAFLIQHSNSRLDSPVRESCIKDFEHFIELQTQEIQSLKAAGISKPECFGF